MKYQLQLLLEDIEMNRESTIEALKAALQEVEEKKRRILIALRYLNPDVSQNAPDAGIEEESDDTLMFPGSPNDEAIF